MREEALRRRPVKFETAPKEGMAPRGPKRLLRMNFHNVQVL